MDSARKRCSIALMWKTLAALLLFSTSALAQENPTAYDALRVVGTKLNRDFVNRVISMTGVNGNPQPETWKILLEDQRARGGVATLFPNARPCVRSSVRPKALRLTRHV